MLDMTTKQPIKNGVRSCALDRETIKAAKSCPINVRAGVTMTKSALVAACTGHRAVKGGSNRGKTSGASICDTCRTGAMIRKGKDNFPLPVGVKLYAQDEFDRLKEAYAERHGSITPTLERGNHEAMECGSHEEKAYAERHGALQPHIAPTLQRGSGWTPPRKDKPYQAVSSDIKTTQTKTTKDNTMQTDNTLGELNKKLFAQLDRLADEKLSGEKLSSEINRAKAVTDIACQIISVGGLALKARIALKNGTGNNLPKMLEG